MGRMGTILLLAMTLMVPPGIGAVDLATFDGSYEVTSRLELPHVERWAIDRTVTVCLSADDAIPVPVFSANNPFARCTATNLVQAAASITYDIVCPGRASARGQAQYSIVSGGFTGRVAMVLAAKNMTMTEVVRARRLGACAPETPQTGSRF
jgi:Protein of unknown function (DUF3617)